VTLAGAGCTAAFVLVYAATVRTKAGRRLGDLALRGAMRTHSQLSDQVDRILDVVSVAMLLGAVAVIAVIALARLRRSTGLAAIGLLAGANLSTKLLKDYVLTRPDLGLSEVSPATWNSMPSGHTTAAFSVVAGVLFVVPVRLRGPLAVGGIAYATATALATMSSGWHRAGDSVAAFLVVGVWMALATGAILIGHGPVSRPVGSAGHWHHDRRWLMVAGGCLAAGSVLTVMLTGVTGLGDGRLAMVAALATAALFIVGTATSMTWMGLALLRLLTPVERPVADAPTLTDEKAYG
jgi:membrane-associated phospholipid phosphatase